jgi:hypothetical protein
MNDQDIVRAGIIYRHRQEINLLREMLDEAVSKGNPELLLNAKLWAESLVAVHQIERAAHGFNK